MSKAHEMSRRGFVTAVGGATVCSVGALAVAGTAAAGSGETFAYADEPDGAGTAEGHSYGMLVDVRKCTGCGACLTACHRQNHLPDQLDFIRFEKNRRVHELGSYIQTVPLQCMHCEDAPCAAVCPTGATKVQPDGVVSVDEGRCIGCKYCMAACPFSARVYNEEKGTVDKCRLCASKVATSDDLMITCVQACTNGVRIFGDLNDPESQLVQSIQETGAQPLGQGLARAKFYFVG